MTEELSNQKNVRENERGYYPLCCCVPVSRTPFGLSVFGGILVVVGGLWLLAEFGLLPALLNISLWPFVLILIGAAYLINSFSMRE